MDNLKEFLESSTIHGLSYISTTRTFRKLFWIFIVIGGFVFAGKIIGNSFNTWRKYPISTTVNTLPISKVKFPLVNVCPPEDTFTTMNYDLVMADNATLDKDVRDDLVRLSTEWVQDQEFMEMVEKTKKF